MPTLPGKQLPRPGKQQQLQLPRPGVCHFPFVLTYMMTNKPRAGRENVGHVGHVVIIF